MPFGAGLFRGHRVQFHPAGFAPRCPRLIEEKTAATTHIQHPTESAFFRQRHGAAKRLPFRAVITRALDLLIERLVTRQAWVKKCEAATHTLEQLDNRP